MTHHRNISHIPHALTPDEAANPFTKEAALDEAVWRAVKVWGPGLPYEKRELIFEAAKALIIAAVRRWDVSPSEAPPPKVNEEEEGK